ncbi:MAG: VPLPA-CTERM sorting domain-containing protein [Anaerolineales bacterium]|nr:VPLPA-CTERM sorting domain-containing protein [Anaerolineales bacterium]
MNLRRILTMEKKTLLAFVLTCLLASLPSLSSASTITSVASITGGGTATVTPIITGQPNNDDATVPGGNIVVASKVFDSASPIDIVFNVAPSGGITEYFFAEGVANNTPNAMFGYTFELGTGIGANFVPSTPDDGLDFDWPGSGTATGTTPVPTSGVFPTLTHAEDMIVWTGGTLGIGISDAFTFSIDVPDMRSFTLRQCGTPVPLPAAVWLFGTGLIGLIGLARRKVRV